MVTNSHHQIQSVVIIGAGNVATHLAKQIKLRGYKIVQIYSRTPSSAEELSQTIGCPYTCDLETVDANADLYLFSVKDAILQETISKIKTNDALWVHTAGSISQTIFEGHVSRYGILYPLQTFSKARDIDCSVVPLFIEANNKEDEKLLFQFGETLSTNVQYANEEQRKYLHLAAVFVNNFSNHMAAIAAQIVNEHQLPFDALLPLIDETAAKLHDLNPRQAQTGPAVRGDSNVMQKQCDLLTDDHTKKIYKLLSDSIYKYHNPTL